jgi:catalase
MQTAVEWLINELVELDKLLDGRRKNEDATVFKLPPDKLYERAKQMEKEQIIDAHGLRYSDITEETVNGEEYYNKTYSQDRELGKEVTDLLENYKKDKTFKQKSKWTKL